MVEIVELFLRRALTDTFRSQETFRGQFVHFGEGVLFDALGRLAHDFTFRINREDSMLRDADGEVRLDVGFSVRNRRETDCTRGKQVGMSCRHRILKRCGFRVTTSRNNALLSGSGAHITGPCASV